MHCSSLVYLSHSEGCIRSCHLMHWQGAVLCLIAPAPLVSWALTCPKSCLQESSWSTFGGECAWSGALVQQKVFHLLFFVLFDPLPLSLFRHVHHQPHKSLPQQLKSDSFCPSRWEKNIILQYGQDLPGLLSPREGSQKNSSQLFLFQYREFTAMLCRSFMHFFVFYFFILSNLF